MKKELNEYQINFIKENFNKIPNYKIYKQIGIGELLFNRIVNELGLIRIMHKFDNCVRICPSCDGLIIFTNPYNCRKSERLKQNCRKCDDKLRSIRMQGAGAPFYSKKHTEENKKYLSEIRKGKPISQETKNKISENNKNRNLPSDFKKGHIPTHDPNFYNIWKEKYDEETYNQKVKNHKEKISKNTSGKNNPMYGKPSPNGSGNGWSGWYNDWFFRSINELSYMILVIDRFNLKWENGEQDKYKIKYIDWEGKERNYFPDFIINEKYIVECKPKKLWNTPNVTSKREYAKIFCEERNMIYKLVCCRRLTIEELIELRSFNKIKFTDRYEFKFIEKYLY